MIEPNEENELNGGVQKIYNFDNDFSASVIRHSFSYGNEDGLWELAILYKGKLTYETYITDDVIGNISEEEVQKILIKIKNLTWDNRFSASTQYEKDKHEVDK